MASESPKSLMEPTDVKKATISTPYVSRSHFSATAPAATRAMVSRALLRSPPELALMPYFAAVLDARGDRHLALLIARGGDGRLAGAAAVELRLDARLCEREAGRAVVDDA